MSAPVALMSTRSAGIPWRRRRRSLRSPATFGHYTQATPWADVRTLPWSELTILLTRHEAGPKEGSGIVPATFSGTPTDKADAQRIDVAFLDSDAGATLQEITAAIGARGWAAAVSSTHSHLTTRTRAKRGNWDRFRTAAAATDEDGTPAELPGNREGLSAGRSPKGALVVQEEEKTSPSSTSPAQSSASPSRCCGPGRLPPTMTGARPMPPGVGASRRWPPRCASGTTKPAPTPRACSICPVVRPMGLPRRRRCWTGSLATCSPYPARPPAKRKGPPERAAPSRGPAEIPMASPMPTPETGEVVDLPACAAVHVNVVAALVS